jgi:hypothetical protein
MSVLEALRWASSHCDLASPWTSCSRWAGDTREGVRKADRSAVLYLSIKSVAKGYNTGFMNYRERIIRDPHIAGGEPGFKGMTLRQYLPACLKKMCGAPIAFAATGTTKRNR